MVPDIVVLFAFLPLAISTNITDCTSCLQDAYHLPFETPGLAELFIDRNIDLQAGINMLQKLCMLLRADQECLAKCGRPEDADLLNYQNLEYSCASLGQLEFSLGMMPCIATRREDFLKECSSTIMNYIHLQRVINKLESDADLQKRNRLAAESNSNVNFLRACVSDTAVNLCPGVGARTIKTFYQLLNST